MEWQIYLRIWHKVLGQGLGIKGIFRAASEKIFQFSVVHIFLSRCYFFYNLLLLFRQLHRGVWGRQSLVIFLGWRLLFRNSAFRFSISGARAFLVVGIITSVSAAFPAVSANRSWLARVLYRRRLLHPLRRMRTGLEFAKSPVLGTKSTL